jgi:hypothetical protein
MRAGYLRLNSHRSQTSEHSLKLVPRKPKHTGKIAYATDLIAYATELAGFAAVGAEAAYFCAGYGDFYAAVAGDLGF